MDIKEESDKIPFMLMEQIGINEQLKEELDKKDKIINEIAIDLEYINAEILDEYDKIPYAESKQKIIEYFTKKVEGK